MPIELFTNRPTIEIERHEVTDRRCTVDVQGSSGKYTFKYKGETHQRKTQEAVHRYFLDNCPELDTIHLQYKNGQGNYFLRFMLDEPETYKNLRQLRAELSHQSNGAWIEQEGNELHYFIDKGWLFSRANEVSEEEFQSYRPSVLKQKATAVVLGSLAMAPAVVETARHLPVNQTAVALALSRSPELGTLGVALCGISSAYAQTPTLTPTPIPIPTPTPIPPTSSEFKVNTITTNVQDYPSVACLLDGSFVTVWHGGQTGNYDIYGQRYDASGSAQGSEFRINTNTTNNQYDPVVASLTDGGFVVVWEGGQTGDYDIYGQRYDASGNPLGSEFRINTITTSDQAYPAIASLLGGGFVTLWEGYQTGDYDIYGQRHDGSGNALGSEFRINTNTTNVQDAPSVASLLNGGFVAIWKGGQTGTFNIYGQRCDASGNLLGSEFRIYTNMTSFQEYPAVARLLDGGFVTVWAGGQTGNYDIFGQRYDALGNALGSEFRINTNTTNSQYYPAVASLPDGGFVTIWMGYQTGTSDIYGQRFDASGNPLGSEFRINTNTTNDQFVPAVASLLGGFVAVWQGQQTGDPDIYGRLFSNASLPASSTISSYKSSISPSTSPSLTSTPVQGSSGATSSTAASQTTSSMIPDTSTPSPSLTPTPIPSSSTISTVPVYVLPPVESLVYGQTYPLYFNGQIIGSYTITGGVGPVKESSSNAIVISLNNNIDLPEGTPIELFTVPTATGTWATTSSFLTSTECEQVDPSVTLNNGSPIFIVTTIHLCSLGTRQALIASISLTL